MRFPAFRNFVCFFEDAIKLADRLTSLRNYEISLSDEFEFFAMKVPYVFKSQHILDCFKDIQHCE